MKKYYKHYKGGVYKLIYEGTHHITQENYVVYENITNSTIYVTPKIDFFRFLKIKNYYVPKFEEILRA